MTGKLGPFVFVDGVRDVGIGTLDLDFAAYASLGGMAMATGALRDNSGTS